MRRCVADRLRLATFARARGASTASSRSARWIPPPPSSSSIPASAGSRCSADPRAAAQCADRLCRRQRRLSLWQAQRGRAGGARPGPARPAGRAVPPAARGHRLQHRLDHRARPCPRRARHSGGRHGPGDQAGGRAVEEPGDRRARHRGDRPPALCRRPRRALRRRLHGHPPRQRPSWSSWPKPSWPANASRSRRSAPRSQPMFGSRAAREMDVMVLACTHFPLLAEEIARGLPGHRPGRRRARHRPPHRLSDPRPAMAGRRRARASRCSPATRRAPRCALARRLRARAKSDTLVKLRVVRNGIPRRRR